MRRAITATLPGLAVGLFVGASLAVLLGREAATKPSEPPHGRVRPGAKWWEALISLDTPSRGFPAGACYNGKGEVYLTFQGRTVRSRLERQSYADHDTWAAALRFQFSKAPCRMVTVAFGNERALSLSIDPAGSILSISE